MIKNEAFGDMAILDTSGDNVVLFHPHIPKKAMEYVADTLNSRWIGQGPKVDKFEREFSKIVGPSHTSIAVGSGTDSLHLAYILAGLQPGDEVIAPVFTCTATNIPFLYMGVKVIFADVQKGTLNIDPVHVRKLVNKKNTDRQAEQKD